MIRLVVLVIFWFLVDAAVTVCFLAHGNHWSYINESIRDRSVATTGFDFLFIFIARQGVLIGSIIGIAFNAFEGPKRADSLSDFINVAAVGVTLYVLVKILLFSESTVFLQGADWTVWFWLSCAWCILALGVSCGILSRLSKVKHGVTVETWENDDITDNATLNGSALHEGAPSTNDPTPDEKESPDSDDVLSSDDDGDKSKDKKKSFGKLVNKVTIMKMLSYSKPDLWLIAVGIFFLLGAAMAETVIPLFTGKVITGIAIDQDSEKFTKNIIIMALITVTAAVCAGCRGGILKLAISRFNIRIRNHLFRSITKQEVGFFDMNKTGDMISRLTSDTSTMSDMIGLNCNIFLRSLVKGVGTCFFMFSLSWRLSIATFMALPLVIGMSKLYGKYYKELQRKIQDAYASANEIAEEVVSSIRTVRSFANELGENERYNQKMLSVYNVEKKQALAYAGYMMSTELSILALVTGTLWYGGHLVTNNMMKSENLISFILYQMTLGGCMSDIGSVYTGLMQALGAAEKVFKLIDRNPKIEIQNTGGISPRDFIGHVTFDNVTFSYPSRPNQCVLKNVSFTAEPGKVTALVGPSGSGKSTCINLLQYFYQCSTGCVRINGNAIQKYNHKYLHQKISLVGQEPVLYARSVKENIAYGLEEQEIHMADVVSAARKANAHQFITELQDQYDTETGEKGTQLSGGQKQRVAIARALIRDPRILILDEATSALDTESEYLVQQALQETMKNRTVIVVAHRLSTVEKADKIIVMDKGKIIEEGTHNTLMDKKGVYHKLVRRQLQANREGKQQKHEEEENDKSSSGENFAKSSPPQEIFSPGRVLSQSFRSIASSLSSEKSIVHDSDSDVGDPLC